MLTKIIYFSLMTPDAPPVLNFMDTLKSVLGDKNYSDIEFVSYDIEDDEAQYPMHRYNVEDVPSTLFFDEEGELIRRLRGIVPAYDLKRYIEFDLTNRILSKENNDDDE